MHTISTAVYSNLRLVLPEQGRLEETKQRTVADARLGGRDLTEFFAPRYNGQMYAHPIFQHGAVG